MSDETVVVGDLGGTHARFALARRGAAGGVQLLAARTLLAADHARGEDALRVYLADHAAAAPQRAALAVAGPVVDGEIRFTNLGWHCSEHSLAAAGGLQQVQLLNDFVALGLGVEQLGPGQWQSVGPDLQPRADGCIAAVGAGTGFGVTAVARRGALRIALPGEGGHVSFAPTDAVEQALWQWFAQRYPRVSVERLLCGQGLLEMHQALCQLNGRRCAVTTARELSAAADAGDNDCAETLLRFFAIMGSVAGDVALSFGATGGLYIGGGIAPDRLVYLQRSAFRARFEAKGRLSEFVRRIPTRVITAGEVALLGAASVALADEERRE